jgi:hypothetical protein
MAVTMKTASHPRRVVPADFILNTPKIKNTTTALQIVPAALKYSTLTFTL